jgi:flagellar biosynthesis protein FlhF
MTADVRTFKADNTQAALDIVRREMGQNAVILHTRQIDKRRLLPWLRRRQEVEVTAGLGANVRPVTPATRRFANAADLVPPPPLLELAAQRRNTVAPPKWSPNDVVPDDASPPSRKSTAAPVNRLPASQAQTIAARARTATAAKPPTKTASPDATAVSERFDQLQRMILELGRERRPTTLHDVPTELFQLFTALIDADVEDELARELICKARQHATASQLRHPETLWPVLTGLVERELKIAGPITPARGRRKVVALIGPTGVGKTTTLAKLAANFRLRDGVRLGLVTVDTYRIAAVEQLKTYAELIDLPMKVVTTPEEMRRALDEFSGLDLVLIDTAGRSPQDEPKIHELQQLIQAAHADEVHLVLSLTSSMKALANVNRNFQPAGVTSLILTKLDEAPSLGSLFNLARKVALPISYVTTGQDVPDDIEPAHAARLSRLILGQDRLS